MNRLKTSLIFSVWSILFLVMVGVVPADLVYAAKFESFLKPANEIDLVSAGRDIIEKIHVREGDEVKQDQLLVSLRSDVLLARYKAANIVAKARGRIDGAQAIEKMREKLLEDLTTLKKSGNVRQRELDRAKTDLAIARAEVLALEEERMIRLAELEQIKALLSEKKIRSPISGIVTRIYKERGELTGTNDKDILLTLVQPQPLKAIFHIPVDMAARFMIGDKVNVIVSQLQTRETAVIDFVSPVTNPESATVRINVSLLENLQLQAGLRCHLELTPSSE